ncbi:cytochrome c oxidase assembly protein subunit 15 [Actinomycetospora corticicola]|uniref:Cytochrome c oxidase assembly protein subunit 15 n=2 Tax=Actinomycetospora corticicola TaxID=663602 RepID=A0A7Y9DTV2_9PSEU|nr:cytochrome c oxidase assembly protein subunit 15 [Actinomycetospora corticicola]
MRTPPALMRGLAVAAVVGQGGIAVTGAAVRVTGSGLGCPTWPQCFPGSMVPVAHAEVAVLHQWIEFGNRLLGIALVLVTAACVIAALFVRPRRRRLLLLACTMPLGVVAQAVLGGITVLTGLAWYTVAPHFIVSVPLVWLAVLLARDAWALPDAAEQRETVVPRSVRGLVGVSAGVLFVLVVLGTLVTAAGPHAGDPATPRLTAFSVADLAMAHAHVLFAFLGLLVGLGFLLHAVAAPRSVLVRFRVLVGVTLAQGLLGGIQYAIGVPEVLVALHVLGSMLVVAATAWLWAGTTRPAVADPSWGSSPREMVAAQA